MFAIALWDARQRPARAGARPLRDQAALLPRRRRPALLRLRAEGAAAPARVLARDRPRRARGVPRLQLDPGAAHDLPRGAQAAAGPHAGGRGGRRSSSRRYARPAPVRAERGPRPSERRGARRGAARAPARLGARAPRLRRAGRRAALGRHRLVARSRRWPRPRAATGSARSRSASRSARSTSSSWRALVAERYGTDHHELVAAPGRGRPAAAARRGLRRAVRATRRRCRPTSSRSSPRAPSRSRSRARAATSSSAATTPTSPTCWRRASAGPRRCCARWSSGCRAPRRR